jgi:hypothetical protein
MTLPPPSPEVKAILKEWCDMQREKYGPDWKNILAKEMSERTGPVIDALLQATKGQK